MRLVAVLFSLLATVLAPIQLAIGDSSSHSAGHNSSPGIGHGQLEIQGAHTFATAPGAPSAGGYVTITNHSDEDDVLIDGTTAIARKLEFHEMKMDGDVMQMRRLTNGVIIPAKGSVTLKRGGYHVMFIGLEKPLQVGQSTTATLTFKNAGDVDVEFEIRDLRDATAHSHSKHSHGDHSKGNEGDRSDHKKKHDHN